MGTNTRYALNRGHSTIKKVRAIMKGRNVTRYYENGFMNTELREAISVTFDMNMTLLGKTFRERTTWIFNEEIRKAIKTLYHKKSHNLVLWNGKIYGWILSTEKRVPTVTIFGSDTSNGEANPFLQ